MFIKKVSRLRLYKMRVLKYYIENKAHENMVNENKVLYGNSLRCETIKKKVVFPYVKLTNRLF